MPSFYQFANPETFERIARPLSPVLGAATLVLLVIGLYFALIGSPEDVQHRDTVRIMYVHVPAAWMALFCYTAMTISSVIGFVWKHPLADVAAKSTAPLGAAFTFLALVTGSLWGKPMWGAWWAWDARLTSVLILFFLYLGYIAVWEAIDDKVRAARLAAIVCVVGFINIPIIKFSVDWWTSLHQPASVFRADGPTIHPSMLTPLFLMAIAYSLFYGWYVITAMRAEIAERRLDRLGADAARAPSRLSPMDPEQARPTS